MGPFKVFSARKPCGFLAVGLKVVWPSPQKLLSKISSSFQFKSSPTKPGAACTLDMEAAPGGYQRGKWSPFGL